MNQNDSQQYCIDNGNIDSTLQDSVVNIEFSGVFFLV